MKYLKLFEEWRPSKGNIPINKISEEEFKKLLRENCQDFISLVKSLDYDMISYKSFLFRMFKMDHGDFVHSHPSQSEHVRIAPWSNWGNYHNLMISNLESWSDYPRRNKSLICAGHSRARNHDGFQLYLVIPYDKTKIGVCKNSEFWDAFKIRELLPKWCSDIINVIQGVNGISLDDEKWESILPYLDKMYDVKKLMSHSFLNWSWYDDRKTLLENLNNYLSPDNNDFKLLYMKDLPPLLNKTGNECWFEDECLMIKWSVLMNDRAREVVLTKEELISLFG